MINAGTVAAYLTLDTSAFDAGIHSALLSIAGFDTGRALFARAVSGMEQHINSVAGCFKSMLGSAVTNASAVVTAGVGTIASTVGRLPARAAAAAAGFASSWRTIPSVVTASGVTVTNACSGIVRSGLAELGRMPSAARSIMVQTGRGMVAGLTASQGAIFAKAQYIANTVTAKLRRALGIHSPSKVTREIGRFTVEGMALGMQDNLALVQEQAVQAADAAAQGIAAASMRLAVSAPQEVQPTAAKGMPAAVNTTAASASGAELGTVLDKLERCMYLLTQSSTALEIDGRSFGRLIREYS